MESPIARAISEAFALWALAREELAESLAETWEDALSPFWWITTVVNPAKSIPGEIALRLIQSWDAVEEYGQDMGLIPARVLKTVVSQYVIRPPDGWDHRVMKASDAYRWAWSLFAESAIELVDADLPKEVDVLKRTAAIGPAGQVLTLVKAGQMVEALGTARTLLRKTLVGFAASAGARALSYAGGITIIILAERFRTRMEGKEGSATLAQYALRQDKDRRYVFSKTRKRFPPA